MNHTERLFASLNPTVKMIYMICLPLGKIASADVLAQLIEVLEKLDMA